MVSAAKIILCRGGGIGGRNVRSSGLKIMKILVLGAGRMGHGAAFDLIYNSPDVEAVTVADYDFSKAESIAAQINSSKLQTKQVDASNYADVTGLMLGHDAAISCVNYWHNLELSKAAIETGTNFCDLGGNNTDRARLRRQSLSARHGEFEKIQCNFGDRTDDKRRARRKGAAENQRQNRIS